MHRLFIYGTLKRGFPAHDLIARATFLGNTGTKPYYCLLDLGEYPGLAKCREGESVQGELWEVNADCLSLLDSYEGNEYRREKIELEFPDVIQADSET